MDKYQNEQQTLLKYSDILHQRQVETKTLPNGDGSSSFNRQIPKLACKCGDSGTFSLSLATGTSMIVDDGGVGEQVRVSWGWVEDVRGCCRCWRGSIYYDIKTLRSSTPYNWYFYYLVLTTLLLLFTTFRLLLLLFDQFPYFALTTLLFTITLTTLLLHLFTSTFTTLLLLDPSHPI